MSTPTPLRKTRSTRSTSAAAAENAAAAGNTAAASSSSTATSTPASTRKRKASTLKEVEEAAPVDAAAPADAPASGAAASAPASASSSSSSASAAAPATPAPGMVTPAKPAVPGSASRIPLTPNRAARLEEKAELQELNKRLELYILKMRERDDSSGGMQRLYEELRARTAQEMEQVKALAADQLREIRAQRDASLAQAAAFEEQLKRVSEQLKERSAEVSLHKSYAASADAKAAQMATEWAAARAKLMTLELQLKAQTAQTESDANQLKQLEIELKKQRERAGKAGSDESAAVAAARTAKEDYQLLVQKYKQETSQLAAQVAALTSQHTSVEDTLRKEFSKQLEELLQERLLQFEEEKAQGLNELKAVYEAKLSSYRESLESVGSEMEAERGRIEAMRVEVSKAQATATEAVNARDALSKRATELASTLDAIHKRHAAEVADKTAALTKIKAIFRRKDEEFEELMGVKIALAMEIKAYRLMLEKEEERLGYAPGSGAGSAAASANVNGSGSALGSAKKRKVATDKTEKLGIERVDLDRQFVVIRNSTTDATALRGWVLRTREGKDEFKFPPNLVLQPGNTVTVWAGKAFKPKEKAPTDLVWMADSVWHNSGDAALLVSAAGEVVSRVEVMPKH